MYPTLVMTGISRMRRLVVLRLDVSKVRRGLGVSKLASDEGLRKVTPRPWRLFMEGQEAKIQYRHCFEGLPDRTNVITHLSAFMKIAGSSGSEVTG
jgi:hypothetical protein